MAEDLVADRERVHPVPERLDHAREILPADDRLGALLGVRPGAHPADPGGGTPAPVPAAVRAVLLGAPTSYRSHDELVVGGREVDWWLDRDGTVRASTVVGLARAVAWAAGAWALRSLVAEVLTDPAAFLLALRVARASDDLRLAALGRAETVADRVVQLAGTLGDHRVSTDELRRGRYPEGFQALRALPTADEPKAFRAAHAKAIAQDVERVSSLDPLADLVDAFDDAKRRRGAVQFSDQVRLALDAVSAHAGAVDELRARHRAVLLDEFQDTSVLQLQLIHALFDGSPVMAVGDPNQAIYGWRGASVSNILEFGQDFPARDGRTTTYPLTVNRRSDERILATANHLAADLYALRPELLPLEAKPGAVPGEVRAVEHHRAAARWQQAADHLEQRRLAGAVRADDARGPPGLEAQREPGEDVRAGAVAGDDVADLQPRHYPAPR